MFQRGETGAPSALHFIDGQQHVPGVVPAVRMYLFSALLAVLHAILGYRVENVFLLNGVLGLFVGLMLYWAGALANGPRGGLLAFLLFLGLPLWAQNVTSGGYDVLNLVFILAFLLASHRYYTGSGEDGLNLMIICGVLLAYCRYESIVYLLLAVLAAGLKWRSEGRITLTWFAVVSPLLLWPCFTANAIMMSNDAFTLAKLREEGAGFFDIRYWNSNLAEAVFYAFDFDRGSTNSLVLSVLGSLSLLVVWVAVAGRCIRKRPDWTVSWIALFGVWASVIYALVLSNFWGMPTHSSATRFILPLMLLMALVVPFAWRELLGAKPIPASLLGIVGLFTIVLGGSVSSKSFQTNNMVFPQIYSWFLKQAQSRSSGNEILFVAPSSLYLAVHQMPSIPTAALRNRLIQAELSLEAGLYKEILVLDIRWQETLSGRWGRHSEDVLPQNADFEVLAVQDMPRNYQARLLRLVPRPLEEALPDSSRPRLRTEFSSDLERRFYLHTLLP
jgi:hypothetical protein